MTVMADDTTGPTEPATIPRCGRLAANQVACRRPLERTPDGLRCRRHGASVGEVVHGPERAASRGGSPGVGGRRHNVYLGRDADAAVDERMAREGITDAEAVRRYVTEGIAAARGDR